jgi:hypothetical protein
MPLYKNKKKRAGRKKMNRGVMMRMAGTAASGPLGPGLCATRALSAAAAKKAIPPSAVSSSPLAYPRKPMWTKRPAQPVQPRSLEGTAAYSGLYKWEGYPNATPQGEKNKFKPPKKR